MPKVVEFFRGKKIKQIALAQAHTLVLTFEKINDLNTQVYVFGSNHYGQLGIGFGSDDVDSKKNFTISSVPVIIKFDEDIRLIHTQYFVNYAVTESNKLMTWGLSPPELRIINQSKKRAKANQKLKDSMQEGKDAAEAVIEVPPEINAEIVENSDEPETPESSIPAVNIPEIKIDEVPSIEVEPQPANSKASAETPVEDPNAAVEEYVGHLFPSEIDTTELDGDIIYISSGIYHYALITTNSTLFLWGEKISLRPTSLSY